MSAMGGKRTLIAISDFTSVEVMQPSYVQTDERSGYCAREREAAERQEDPDVAQPRPREAESKSSARQQEPSSEEHNSCLNLTRWSNSRTRPNERDGSHKRSKQPLWAFGIRFNYPRPSQRLIQNEMQRKGRQDCADHRSG
jgi:hypothetical protein